MDTAATSAQPLPGATGLTRARVSLAVLGAVVAVALLALTLVLAALSHESLAPGFASPAILVPAAIGLLIALRRPANAIGWLLLANAVIVGLDFVVEPYARYAIVTQPGSLPGARWALLWDASDWPTLFAGITALAFVFPDGRLLPGRWRKVALGAGVAFTGLLLVQAFEPQHFGGGGFRGIASPLPAIPERVLPFFLPFWIGTFASLFAAALAVRARFRRASGVERLQLLWLAYAALLIPAALVTCLVEEVVTGRVGPATLAALMLALTALPAAVGIAVFRHRLFDIELALSRTLVYGALSLCVAVAYLGLVVGLDTFVHVRGVVGALAAALVALGALPLRDPLQRRVRRLVYGDRADPYVALARLGERLEAAPAAAEVLRTIVESVARALRLGYTAIALERDGVYEIVAAQGRSGRTPQVGLPLSYQARILGRLLVEPSPGAELTALDRRLLGDLARQAGAAVHAVRLTAALQLSRERLVTAREEERRRLRRDLHDGLGPALAGIVLKLGAARGALAEDPELAERLLAELRIETQEAIADIRRLVYELRPPALDELGLMGALREQAARLGAAGGPAIGIHGPERLPALPAAVEVAAYRIAGEALTNAARHGHAGACRLEIELNGSLTLEISDDGDGLPRNYRSGVGLGSMQQRAEELGGTCTVSRRSGGGTLVRALIPLDSS